MSAPLSAGLSRRTYQRSGGVLVADGFSARTTIVPDGTKTSLTVPPTLIFFSASADLRSALLSSGPARPFLAFVSTTYQPPFVVSLPRLVALHFEACVTAS